MATEPITLKIGPEAARAFKAISSNDREKLEALMTVLLHQYANANSSSLKKVMDEIGEKAQRRGLTADILESILEAD